MTECISKKEGRENKSKEKAAKRVASDSSCQTTCIASLDSLLVSCQPFFGSSSYTSQNSRNAHYYKQFINSHISLPV